MNIEKAANREQRRYAVEGQGSNGAGSPKLLIGLHVLLSTTAVAAGAALATRPDGSALGFSTTWLKGSPFEDYRVPGLFLAIVIGGMNASSAWGLATRRTSAPVLSLMTGLLLLAWLVIQTAIIGVRHPSQALWPALFGSVTLLAWREVRRSRSLAWRTFK